MNPFVGSARRVAADLERLDVAYALIGGFAVSVRSEPRFTQDLDLAVVAATDEVAEAVVRDLVGRGYVTGAVVEHETQGRLATARMQMPTSDQIADLLFASSGIESEIVAEAEVIDVLPELSLPVARVGHLIALKLLARDDDSRPQDLADLRALMRVADGTELERAAKAVELIAERGYNRGRDLGAALEELLTT